MPFSHHICAIAHAHAHTSRLIAPSINLLSLPQIIRMGNGLHLHHSSCCFGHSAVNRELGALIRTSNGLNAAGHHQDTKQILHDNFQEANKNT